MKWTASRPTEVGIYWRRLGRFPHTEHLVHVYEAITMPRVLFVAHVNSNCADLVDDTPGIYEWSDLPIGRPEEPPRIFA